MLVTARTSPMLQAFRLNKSHWAARGLVGWWPVGNRLSWQSGILRDMSLYGNHGTLINIDPATDYVADDTRRALDFDGVNDYVSCGIMPAIAGGTAITFAAWAWQAVHHAAAYFNKHGSDLLCQPWTNGKIYWQVGGSLGRAVTGSGVYPLAAWYHVVATYDGAALAIFVDGAQKAASAKVTTLPVLGAVQIAYNSVDGYFHGRMDDIRIYDRALSAREVKQLYLDTLDGGCGGLLIPVRRAVWPWGVIGPTLVDGPYSVDAGQLHVTGHAAGQLHVTGAEAGQLAT